MPSHSSEPSEPAFSGRHDADTSSTDISSTDASGTDASSTDAPVYRFHPALRSLGLLGPVLVVPLAAFYLFRLFGSGAPLHASTDLGVGAVALAAALGAMAWAIPSLLTSVRLTSTEIRRERPLRASESIRFARVGLLVVGDSAVEVCTDDGRVAVSLDRSLQGIDDLLARLADRLPARAEVDNPGGAHAEALADLPEVSLPEEPESPEPPDDAPS